MKIPTLLGFPQKGSAQVANKNFEAGSSFLTDLEVKSSTILQIGE